MPIRSHGFELIRSVHLARAAIAATMAALTEMIGAGVFRAVDANFLRCVAADGTNEGTGLHLMLMLSGSCRRRRLAADHAPAALRLFIGHPEVLFLGLG